MLMPRTGQATHMQAAQAESGAPVDAAQHAPKVEKGDDDDDEEDEGGETVEGEAKKKKKKKPKKKKAGGEGGGEGGGGGGGARAQLEAPLVRTRVRLPFRIDVWTHAHLRTYSHTTHTRALCHWLSRSHTLS